MKIQDILFFITFGLLLHRRDPKLFAIFGALAFILAIPLFSLLVFFTAERLTWYAGAFFLAATILYLRMMRK